MYIVNLLTSPHCIVLRLRAFFSIIYGSIATWPVRLFWERKTIRERNIFFFFLRRNLKFAKCLLCLYGLFFLFFPLTLSLLPFFTRFILPRSMRLAPTSASRLQPQNFSCYACMCVCKTIDRNIYVWCRHIKGLVSNEIWAFVGFLFSYTLWIGIKIGNTFFFSWWPKNPSPETLAWDCSSSCLWRTNKRKVLELITVFEF